MRLLTVLSAACVSIAFVVSATPLRGQTESSAGPSRHLYVWTGDADGNETEFLAVLDVAPASPRYGRIISTLPVGIAGTMPHHMEFELPDGHPVFANAYHAGRTFLFDLSEPEAPRLAGSIDSVPGFRHPHSFLRLPSGNVVATLQHGDSSSPGDPGGLAEFDPSGTLVRTSSAADPRFEGARIRTYSIVGLVDLDRLVTTSTPMDLERTADVIQVWRLSDLQLLYTIALDSAPPDSMEYYPFEARVLEDGRTLLLNTYYCALYRITGLDRPDPAAEFLQVVRSNGTGCGVPIVLGRWWLVPVAYGHEIVVFDVSDPARPLEATRLATDPTFNPHWLAADPRSDRIVVTDQGDGEPRVMIAVFDQATGRLAWDERFREEGSNRSGFSFDRAEWPHGPTGPAVPHAALFGP